MMQVKTSLLLTIGAALAFAATPIPPVKFTDTRLDNGLRVIISEDHAAPVFAICVTYAVGSKDERQGRTGFAHLFEHMMFKGSENVGPGEHFYLVFNNGGSMNGTTNEDRTNYYEILPKNQLDLGLFLEADRMRSLAITKDNLDNQRNAVQEERRLGIDNRPYGRTYERMGELVYSNFAYQHSVIGSMTDLNAASVEDVHQFFRTYYAPNNAVLALVGDLDTKATLEKVKKYFGSIPRQQAPKPVDLTEPKQTGEKREVIPDKLARLAQVDVVYKVPAGTDKRYHAAAVLVGILGQGESSRLYQKLVKDKELAAQTFAYPDARLGPSSILLSAVVRPGKKPEEVESEIAEEISKLHSEPVTEQELERARAAIRRGAIQTRQSALARAIRLSEDAALYNDPNRINSVPAARLAVTAADIQALVREYMTTPQRTVMHTIPAGAPPARKKQ